MRANTLLARGALTADLDLTNWSVRVINARVARSEGIESVNQTEFREVANLLCPDHAINNNQLPKVAI